MSRLTRVLNLLRSKSLARDLDDEIRFHLDERIRMNLAAGMNPPDAEARARMRFGRIEHIRAGMREARVARWLDVAPIFAVAIALLVAGGTYWRNTERVYEVGDGVTAPVPITTPKPEYTLAARRAKIQGTVRLRCVVQTEGVCSRVVVVRSLDKTFGLDDEAVRAIGEWRFRPALREGTPVASRIMFDVTFALR